MIKFTSSISMSIITYLDLDIYIQNNKLHTKTHFKATNISYLHGHPNHPPSTFKGIYKGENICILGNTADKQQYNSTMQFLTKKSKQCKYPTKLTTNPLIPCSDRNKLLACPNHQPRTSTNFITTYKPPTLSRTNILEDWPWLSVILNYVKFFEIHVKSLANIHQT